jgi:hypothetical protein
MSLPKTSLSRRVFMVLSPRSPVYARFALKSLLINAGETVHLHLITDSALDKDLLFEEISIRQSASRHCCTIHSKEELRDREAALFAAYPNLRSFRNGHPCWRKITDPLLLSEADEEIVVLDHDLYFPNRFVFEETPNHGLLLMWQKPTCLLPAAIVETALRRNIALARHVDIGVGHWRANVDLNWLDWLLGKLGLNGFPQAEFFMHIEAIVWAAIAMRIGGGYLPREHWHCWRRSQRIRLLRKLHVPGPQLLRHEPFSTIKCFHAGGEAKHWLEATRRRGWMDSNSVLDSPGTVLPFVELTPRAYHREQAVKLWLRRFGYYSLFQSGALH